MRKINYLFVFLFIAGLFSCGKDGAVGPAGQAGATGAKGATGATGSANVNYSDWIVSQKWLTETLGDQNQYYTNIPAAAITQAIVDKGTVLVYAKLDGYDSEAETIWPAGQVSELPISLTFESGPTVYNDLWSAYISVGNIKIEFYDSGNFYIGDFSANQFRYVVIPGGVHVAATVNLKNYEEVKAALQLKN
jgi:hypothetical protein